MKRYLAGVASALLLAAAGFFLWTGFAKRETSVPAAPQALASTGGGATADLPDAPQASDQTREERRFGRYDHNRDGKVDREEYLQSRRKAFARLDTDGDGKLSFDEYAAKAVAKFAKADADRSNTLDATEFAATRVQRKPRPPCAPTAHEVAPAQPEEES